MDVITIIILTFLLFASSFLMTWLVRSISLKKNIIDIPNERSSHSIPTPRGGGIALVLSWYAGITYLVFIDMLNPNLYYALMSGIILAGTSLVDDLIDLKPTVRLISQIITAILALFFLEGIQSFTYLGIFNIIVYSLLILGIVWFINLYNFLDGIDGYASTEAIFLAFVFYLFSGQIINLVLIASVTGFLIWNWPKAKIFMGDVGSTQLGFIFIILGIHYHNDNKLPIVLWMVLTAPFWVDATLTLLRRWKNNEIISQAHRKHVYQRLVQSGFSHLKVNILLSLGNILLLMLVVFVKPFDFLQFPVLISTVFFIYLIILYIDKRKPFL